MDRLVIDEMIGTKKSYLAPTITVHVIVEESYILAGSVNATTTEPDWKADEIVEDNTGGLDI